MARKAASATPKRIKISGSRAGRLYKLLTLLASGSTLRPQLLKKLKVGMRTFYRDVDLLRDCGVSIETEDSGYALSERLEDALGKLPFPDPELTFSDVLILMKGRTNSHSKLKNLLTELSK